MLRNVPRVSAVALGAATLMGCTADPRVGYDRIKVGDSKAAVDRAMGKPSWVNWAYQWNELSVSFTDGIATAVGMTIPSGSTQRLPVVSGMTPTQVEAIVGSPQEVCNYYNYIPPKLASVCFAKNGTVASKEAFTPPEPPLLPLP
jgi:hypothetical protein